MCVCFWLSACAKAYPSVRASVHVNMCASLHEVSMSVCVCVALEPHPAEVTETMGTDITVGGRGVSRQAAGYPITLAAAAAAAPTSFNSSQGEVSRGQAGSSLCLYPSITCCPLCADNRTFSSTFTLEAFYERPPPFAFSSCLTLPL